jgi:hypothetical protein
MTTTDIWSICEHMKLTVAGIEQRNGCWYVALTDDKGLTGNIAAKFQKTDLRLVMTGCVYPERYFVVVEEREV